ncbi:transposase [Candidatus Enterovibrio escicola]|nr:transposase [Candidatus Enterovibrio escacola]
MIVMDNTSIHKRSDTLKAIEARGCTLESLSSLNNPDLNPIEHKWGKLKIVKNKERCSINALFYQHIDYANLF